MSILQITSVVGGCGVSATAWAVAREISATATLDFSHHQGGLAWASGTTTDVSWPRIASTQLTNTQLIEVARTVEGIRMCSGGSPPDVSVVATAFQSTFSGEHVVFDGGRAIDSATQLLVIPNQLAVLRFLKDYSGALLCLVGPSDIPPSLVRATLPKAHVTFLKHEATISKSLRLGYGVTRTKALSRALDSCLSNLALS